MANFSTYVDIDPDEFIQNCSNSEIEEMVDILIEEGYLEGIPVTSNKHHNLLDMEWNNLIGKLINSRLLLSNEEEEVIKSIASRF
jgi:ribosomal protein S8